MAGGSVFLADQMSCCAAARAGGRLAVFPDAVFRIGGAAETGLRVAVACGDQMGQERNAGAIACDDRIMITLDPRRFQGDHLIGLSALLAALAPFITN